VIACGPFGKRGTPAAFTSAVLTGQVMMTAAAAASVEIAPGSIAAGAVNACEQTTAPSIRTWTLSTRVPTGTSTFRLTLIWPDALEMSTCWPFRPVMF
jgi:hypothetical protein